MNKTILQGDTMFNKTILQNVLTDQWEIVTEQQILSCKFV